MGNNVPILHTKAPPCFYLKHGGAFIYLKEEKIST